MKDSPCGWAAGNPTGGPGQQRPPPFLFSWIKTCNFSESVLKEEKDGRFEGLLLNLCFRLQKWQVFVCSPLLFN